MILYIEDPKDAIRKLLELINEFGKVTGHKINAQKSVHFHTLTTKDQKEKFKKQSWVGSQGEDWGWQREHSLKGLAHHS